MIQTQNPVTPPNPHKAITTGLSGNEMFCLALKGYSPGNIVVGNSVFSLGFFGSLGSGMKTILGGEITQITSLVQEGRELSYSRMLAEANKLGGAGITGVSSDIVFHQGNVEFLSIGSCVHKPNEVLEKRFSSSSDGQELYCQLDAGFQPLKFVFGNVAYSMGLGGGLSGFIRSFARGEVTEYSEIFSTTRHLALERISAEAKEAGANAVLGIETSIRPMGGFQEMLMIGTAAKHPALASFASHPVTSDLTNQELWNVVHMGYMPIRLVMGVSVYSIGIAGGIISAFQSLGRGELNMVSSLLYEARENAIEQMHKEARSYGADDVLGIRTYVYQIGGGLVEFFAIGTAVRKIEGITTLTPSLPPQAVIVDQDTFVNEVDGAGFVQNLNSSRDRSQAIKQAPALIVILIVISMIMMQVFLRGFFHH